jgi:hypothetical protein
VGIGGKAGPTDQRSEDAINSLLRDGWLSGHTVRSDGRSVGATGSQIHGMQIGRVIDSSELDNSKGESS